MKGKASDWDQSLENHHILDLWHTANKFGQIIVTFDVCILCVKMNA
jgi:hypothetical protein